MLSGNLLALANSRNGERLGEVDDPTRLERPASWRREPTKRGCAPALVNELELPLEICIDALKSGLACCVSISEIGPATAQQAAGAWPI